MSVMGMLLRRHLTLIRDLFRWLHLVSITVLALQIKTFSLLWDVVTVGGDDPCPSKGGEGVGGTRSLAVGVRCGAIGSPEELPSGRKQSALLCGMGAAEAWRRESSGGSEQQPSETCQGVIRRTGLRSS